MTGAQPKGDTIKKNRERFMRELKLFVNQKLYDKRLISEDMYSAAKETLIRQAG